MISSSLASRRASRTFSAMEVSKRCGCCSANPMIRRTSSPARPARFIPAKSSCPAAGASRVSAAATVDLPLPLGPVKATGAPGARARSNGPTSHWSGCQPARSPVICNGAPPARVAVTAVVGSALTGGSGTRSGESNTATTRRADSRTRANVITAAGRT